MTFFFTILYIASYIFLDPESITSINASFVGDREMALAWDSPPGDFDAFEVQYLSAADRFVESLTLAPAISITGLQPFRNYTFTVVVRSGSDASVVRRSAPLSAVFSTKESVPG